MSTGLAKPDTVEGGGDMAVRHAWSQRRHLDLRHGQREGSGDVRRGRPRPPPGRRRNRPGQQLAGPAGRGRRNRPGLAPGRESDRGRHRIRRGDGGRVPGPPVHAISPDSRWLVVGGEASGVQIHDAATGHLVHRLAEADAVTQAVMAADATWLATVDNGGVSVWDAATGRPIRRIAHGSAQAPPFIAAIGGTTDGGRLAIADADELTVWNPHAGQSTSDDLPGRDQTGTPRQIHELPGGRLAVVGEHGIHIVDS